MSSHPTTSPFIQYGLNLIQGISDKIGPRPAGSLAELKATQFLQTKLLQFSDQVVIDQFQVYPSFYPQGFIKLTAISLFLSFLSYFLPMPFTLISLFLFFLGLFILFVSLGLMKTWFARLFRFSQKVSYNVIGKISPKAIHHQKLNKSADSSGSQNIPRKIVIIAGHTDSAYEMSISQYGYTYLLLGGIYIGLMLIFIVSKCILNKLLITGYAAIVIMPGFSWGWIDFTVFIISLVGIPIFGKLVMGLINGKPVIGANDNLSGTSIALALGKYFSLPENRLKHVELWIGSFGSEECGERGAFHFIQQHLSGPIQDKVHAIIPDSIGAGNKIVIVSKEFMHFASHDPQLCKNLSKGYRKYVSSISPKSAIPCQVQKLPFGASDAGRFAHQGISSASIIVLDETGQPSNYHLSSDRPENINQQCITDVFNLFLYFLEDLDKRLDLKEKGKGKKP